jgi:hypothetical protein
VKELAKGAMQRIDATQQFTLVKAERQGVIGLAGSGLPSRRLARQDDGEAIGIGDGPSIDGSLMAKSPA